MHEQREDTASGFAVGTGHYELGVDEIREFRNALVKKIRVSPHVRSDDPRRAGRAVDQLRLQHDLGALEPLAIGMTLRQ